MRSGMTTYAITAICAALSKVGYLLMQNPITTPRMFLDRIVVPDIEDVKQMPDDLRAAFHASNSLHHLRGWVFKAKLVPHKTLTEYSEDLYRRHPVLRTIRNFAANVGHYPPERGRGVKMDMGGTAAPSPTLFGPQDVMPRTEPPTPIWTIAREDDGKTTWMTPVILQAFNIWKEEFAANGW